MIRRRLLIGFAALALLANLLVGQAPVAQAIAGRCPDYMKVQGRVMDIYTRDGIWLGYAMATYNATTKYWCLQVLATDRKVTVKGKYNGDIGFRSSDTQTGGLVHVWLAPNPERGCVWLHGFIYTSATDGGYDTRKRCHA